MVRTEMRGGNTPIPLSYRMVRTAEGWKIYDVNVAGLWLSQNYRNTFAGEIRRHGIDGLIDAMARKNAANERR